MKTFVLILLSLFTMMFISCENMGNESVVDSPQDTLIPYLSFTVDTTYLDVSLKELVARGTVTNNGNVKITSPWYVEGQFYTTKNGNIKLGGNYTQIGVPLGAKQATYWSIYFSSSNVDVRNYPDFGVKDLRGIYK